MSTVASNVRHGLMNINQTFDKDSVARDEKTRDQTKPSKDYNSKTSSTTLHNFQKNN